MISKQKVGGRVEKLSTVTGQVCLMGLSHLAAWQFGCFIWLDVPTRGPSPTAFIARFIYLGSPSPYTGFCVGASNATRWQEFFALPHQALGDRLQHQQQHCTERAVVPDR